MAKVQITKEWFNKLEYDTRGMSAEKNASIAVQPLTSPAVLIVFAGADLNAAAYHLTKSLESPFLENAVVTVLLQESIKAEFIDIIQCKLKPYTSNVVQNQNFVNALASIKQLHAKTIVAAGVDHMHSPTIVLDITHEQLNASTPTGVVTLHPFRTAKEAIALCGKETINFKNASIWHENHSCAYELVNALSCTNYFINCHLVPLEPLKAQINAGNSFVCIEKSYHYETLPINGIQKSVVYPIGTIFAN